MVILLIRKLAFYLMSIEYGDFSLAAYWRSAQRCMRRVFGSLTLDGAPLHSRGSGWCASTKVRLLWTS